METVRLALQAMATRFELVLQGAEASHLRAAGEAAFSEIRRQEAQLSFYRPTSEVCRLNAHAAAQPVRVTPRTFTLLQRAAHLHRQTEGAFDPTVGPLMRAWGFVRGTGQHPSPEALEAARDVTGMQHVVLDEGRRTVFFDQPGVEIDLGGIGKGFALDEALLVLEEAGIEQALVHGGTSTALALGRPSDADAWTVAIPAPGTEGATASEVLATVALEPGEALSVSAPWGKAFEANGRTLGHVLDPRLGHPTQGAALAAVALASATDADALSTALLVLGPDGLGPLATFDPALRALVATAGTPEGLFDVATHRLRLFSAEGATQDFRT